MCASWNLLQLLDMLIPLAKIFLRHDITSALRDALMSEQPPLKKPPSTQGYSLYSVFSCQGQTPPRQTLGTANIAAQ